MNDKGREGGPKRKDRKKLQDEKNTGREREFVCVKKGKTIQKDKKKGLYIT